MSSMNGLGSFICAKCACNHGGISQAPELIFISIGSHFSNNDLIFWIQVKLERELFVYILCENDLFFTLISNDA